MTERLTQTAPPPNPEAVLERGLIDCFGRRLRIVEMHAAPLQSYSTHPIDRLRVTLADGEQISVIFKRLSPKPEKDTRQEVLLYERLLAARHFGAPALYASLRDEARGHYWLFLEDVGDWRLDYCPIDDWFAAFRAMARMHAAYYGRESELDALGCLDGHGPAFYQRLAHAARRSLAQNGEPHALARFDQLMGRWLGGSIAYLAGQPRTLVHGDMSCKNLMVQRNLGIRPVDWEWAAIGPATWDLAKLLDGWGREKPRLLAAYLDEFARHTGAPIDRAVIEAALAHCEILHRLWYLRWWIASCRDPAFVDGMLDKMETTWRRLESEGANG